MRVSPVMKLLIFVVPVTYQLLRTDVSLINLSVPERMQEVLLQQPLPWYSSKSAAGAALPSWYTSTSSSSSKARIATRSNRTSTNECILQTPPFHNYQPARLVVFQRDGRQQLKHFVTHYSQVMDADGIVIIDHQGQDPMTRSLLEEYGRLGVHVWRCSGPFDRKAEMWTDIVRFYANDSGYIFPLDVDELIAVKQFTTPPNDDDSEEFNAPQAELQSLVWNRDAFYGSLTQLEQSGKPYKMETFNIVPPECHGNNKTQALLAKQRLITASEDESGSSSSTAPAALGYTSEMCNIRYVKASSKSDKKKQCRRKVFSRGSDFLKTDIGNHNGGTHKYPDLHFAKCISNPLSAFYATSNLGIIHVQQASFEEWLVHGLRGATDRGFTSIKAEDDCSKVRKSAHYCTKWKSFQSTNFSPYELRKLYQRQECPTLGSKGISIVPLQGVFCPS